MGVANEDEVRTGAAFEEVGWGASEAWFRTRDDDGVAATFCTSNEDRTSELVRLLRLGEGVEEDDGGLVEDCRSIGGSPPRLNNLPE